MGSKRALKVGIWGTGGERWADESLGARRIGGVDHEVKQLSSHESRTSAF